MALGEPKIDVKDFRLHERDVRPAAGKKGRRDCVRGRVIVTWSRALVRKRGEQAVTFDAQAIARAQTAALKAFAKQMNEDQPPQCLITGVSFDRLGSDLRMLLAVHTAPTALLAIERWGEFTAPLGVRPMEAPPTVDDDDDGSGEDADDDDEG
jgi:hypothetical protein